MIEWNIEDCVYVIGRRQESSCSKGKPVVYIITGFLESVFEIQQFWNNIPSLHTIVYNLLLAYLLRHSWMEFKGARRNWTFVRLQFPQLAKIWKELAIRRNCLFMNLWLNFGIKYKIRIYEIN